MPLYNHNGLTLDTEEVYVFHFPVDSVWLMENFRCRTPVRLHQLCDFFPPQISVFPRTFFLRSVTYVLWKTAGFAARCLVQVEWDPRPENHCEQSYWTKCFSFFMNIYCRKPPLMEWVHDSVFPTAVNRKNRGRVFVCLYYSWFAFLSVFFLGLKNKQKTYSRTAQLRRHNWTLTW